MEKYAKAFSKDKEIGWVSNNYLFSETGIDIAEITLIDTYGYDVRFDSMSQQDIYSGMSLAVFTFLNGGSKGTLQDEKIGCQRFSLKSPWSNPAPLQDGPGYVVCCDQGG